jgi:hypothetical protein
VKHQGKYNIDCPCCSCFYQDLALEGCALCHTRDDVQAWMDSWSREGPYGEDHDTGFLCPPADWPEPCPGHLDRNAVSFGDLEREVFENQDARCAAKENELRRALAERFLAELDDNALWAEESHKQPDSPEQLARLARVPMSEVRRALHTEVGGRLTLNTLVRIADAFDLDLVISFQAQRREP